MAMRFSSNNSIGIVQMNFDGWIVANFEDIPNCFGNLEATFNNSKHYY